MKRFVMVVVATGSAFADVPIHRITKDDGTIAADTPALTRAINDAFKATRAQYGNRWECGFSEATNIVVSWSCSGTVDSGPNSGGSFHASSTAVYAIENGKLVALDWKKLWAPNAAAKLAKLKGANDVPCSMPTTVTEFTVDGAGLEVEIDDNGHTCSFPWDDITPLLVPNSPLARLAAAERATDISNPMPGPMTEQVPANRFVAEGDAVRDTSTGLVWAARDNGADIDAAGAAAYAKAYRGGGHADWRLPTIDELAAISAQNLAHKDKKDCTKGKNSLLISPLVHLSCGLAWSSTTTTSGQSAFGFISGTPRVSKPTEKKNYRALVVRKGD